ncbi:MAG: 4Fe-4S single cluster domain-containing protein [Bacteroidales bacterium]
MQWRINRIQYPVLNLGPGRRIGIWTQGCAIRCKGCINPELWNSHGGRYVDVARLAAEVVSLCGSYDGITVTGGEPFDQYRQLVAFCTFIKQQTQMSVFVYSGHTLDRLLIKFPDRLFTGCIDYLMDGPFVRNLPSDDPLKGSSNQQLYKVGEEGCMHPEKLDVARRFSFHLSEMNTLFMAGVPRIGEMEQVSAGLMATGINFEDHEV